jgi:hypothetical protein
MREFFTFHALVAFALGVFLSGWVMSLVSRGKSKVAG